MWMQAHGHIRDRRRKAMSVTHGTISGGRPASSGSWFLGIVQQLGGVASRWAARHRAAADARQLYRFTDMELRDIGLSRGDLPAVIKGTYGRD
jgi:uncharacterized protein YjiS (DUF1127 family)